MHVWMHGMDQKAKKNIQSYAANNMYLINWLSANVTKKFAGLMHSFGNHGKFAPRLESAIFREVTKNSSESTCVCWTLFFGG